MVQYIVVGPSSQALGLEIARKLNAKPIGCEFKTFPDNECYLRYDLQDESILKGSDVIIVQSTGANSYGDQNKRFMELFMMISIARRCEAAKIRVVVPYFAYSRQDKVFRPGESIFAAELCRLIQAAGATEFYSVDMHAPAVFGLFSIPAYNINPMQSLANYVKEKYQFKNPVVICPDKGAYERSRAFAKYFGEDVPVVQFNKKRDVVTGQVTMEGEMNVENKDVIIADDIIATGGTMALAIEIAKKSNAKQIIAACTFPLLIGNGSLKLLSSGATAIVGTDAIDSQVSVVSLADVIAEELKKH